MKLYTSLDQNSKNELAFVAKVLSRGDKYPWNIKFVDRKTIYNDNSGKGYEYEILEKGVYQCVRVDDINLEQFPDGKVYAYIDPEQGGIKIRAITIPELLVKLKNGVKIDLDELEHKEKNKL